MPVDIISLLPVEVSIQILGYLSPEDLCRCLGVCKRWRAIAKCDVLWKKHCLDANLGEYKKEEDTSDEFSLGSWATSFIFFGNSCAFRWYRNKYETLRLNSKRNDYCAFSTFGNYFAAYSKTHSNLDIYQILRVKYDNGWGTKIKLISSLALCFPDSPSANVSLHMTEKLLIAVKANIVIVFERSEGQYSMIKAIRIGFQQQIATRDLVAFVTQQFIPDFYAEVYGFIDHYLWVFLLLQDTTMVINVLTNELRSVFSYETGIVMGDYFITWSPEPEEDDLRVYDKRGNIVILLEGVPGVEDAYVNRTLFSTLSASVEEGTLLNVWELSSGNHLFLQRMPTFTWSKLHPSEEILYTLESSLSVEIFKISAWDVRTGSKQWVFKDAVGSNVTSYIITYWELTEVCGRYLIVWPTKNGKDKFLCLDKDSGKLIYESERPCSEESQFNKITDSFWLAVPNFSLNLTVRSYF